jgi:prohibitin 1
MVRKCNELQQLRFFCSSERRDLTTQRELTDRSFTTMAQALNTIYKYAIPLALGVSFAQASIYDVKGGTRAVIFDRLSGVKDQVVNEGTHFLIPWLQKSIIYDVRTKPRNISTTTGSKDLQMVSLTLRVLHRPEVKMLPKIYQV